MTDQSVLWARVDELVAQAPDLSALRRHRLELLAARRQRRLGLALDAELRASERSSAVADLAASFLLRRIRATVDGPLVVMKGPESAAAYPEPGCRPFGDLDVLTPDADGAHAALVAAGFVEATDHSGAGHHTRPLVFPGMPLVVELHRTPHFIPGLPIPASDALFRLTRPSRTGIAGVEGFIPCADAVLLAVHGWAHGPLERIGHLIDIAAVLADGERDRADRLACSWGCERLWRTTIACIDALLLNRPRPIALRTWGRHLMRSREPRVLESYVARTVAPAWALRRSRAARGIGWELMRTVRPYEEESWTKQLDRSRRALARVHKPLSEYRT